MNRQLIDSVNRQAWALQGLAVGISENVYALELNGEIYEYLPDPSEDPGAAVDIIEGYEDDDPRKNASVVFGCSKNGWIEIPFGELATIGTAGPPIQEQLSTTHRILIEVDSAMLVKLERFKQEMGSRSYGTVVERILQELLKDIDE